MKIFVCLGLAGALGLAGCGGKSSSTPAATNASAGGSSPLTAPADYVGALGKGQQKAIKTVDTASLNQAIQLFQVDHGRFPKDLNELVQEKVISQIPEAPAGTKLVYDPAAGTVKVVKQP